MDAGLSLAICPLGPLSIPKLVKATLSPLTTLPRPLKSRRRKWSRRVKLPGAFVEAPDQGIAKIFCPKNGCAYIRAHKYKHCESQDIPTISLVQSVAKGNPFLYWPPCTLGRWWVSLLPPRCEACWLVSMSWRWRGWWEESTSILTQSQSHIYSRLKRTMSPNGWMIIPCKIVPTYALFSSRRQIGLLNVLSFSSGSNLSFASVET